jgi:hypothetical protein
MAFFKLKKRHLTQKQNYAAKLERDQKAAKVAKQPPHEQQYVTCKQKFNSHKTASKHKCLKSKVETACRPLKAYGSMMFRYNF